MLLSFVYNERLLLRTHFFIEMPANVTSDLTAHAVAASGPSSVHWLLLGPELRGGMHCI